MKTVKVINFQLLSDHYLKHWQNIFHRWFRKMNKIIKINMPCLMMNIIEKNFRLIKKSYFPSCNVSAWTKAFILLVIKRYFLLMTTNIKIIYSSINASIQKIWQNSLISVYLFYYANNGFIYFKIKFTLTIFRCTISQKDEKALDAIRQV